MKMKKVLAAALAGTMVMASVVAVSAETVTESTTYDGGQTIDGSSAWNTTDGDNYLISTTPVTVVFENTPFVRDTDNWSNFVFETVASDTADGITLRADAYGWTYGDAGVNTPSYTVETSWGDTWDDFATYSAEDITLVATQTDDSTVTFAIAFGSLATETYTVTYPDGVPSELYFHVGADGGSINVLSATYGSASSDDDSSSDDSSSDDSASASSDDSDDSASTSSDDSSSDDSASSSSDDSSSSSSSSDKSTETGDAAPIAATVVALFGCAAIVVASKKKMA